MPTPKRNVAGNIVKKVVKKVISGDTPAKANARGLKAANKSTKAAKTFIGDNKKVSPEYRRGMLKNHPPLREGRVRGGGMATLKKQADIAARKSKPN